jgi:YHS domain-containing protein
MRTLLNISSLSIVLLLSISACNKKPETKDVPAATATPAPTKPYSVGDKAHCPVTNEEFTVTASTVQVEHEGKHYAFCCADCQPAFAKNPAKYAKK